MEAERILFKKRIEELLYMTDIIRYKLDIPTHAGCKMRWNKSSTDQTWWGIPNITLTTLNVVVSIGPLKKVIIVWNLIQVIPSTSLLEFLAIDIYGFLTKIKVENRFTVAMTDRYRKLTTFIHISGVPAPLLATVLLYHRINQYGISDKLKYWRKMVCSLSQSSMQPYSFYFALNL